MHADRLEVRTEGRGFVEVTEHIRRVVRDSGTRDGLVSVFLKHTSASLVLNENADPVVRQDLERFMSDLAPDGDRRFRHRDEGPDDMPAHVRAVLTHASISLPVRDGRLALGTWQGLYLWEHRTSPHRRTLEVTVLP